MHSILDEKNTWLVVSILQRANLCFDLGEILFHSYERWKGEKNHSKYVNIYIIMHTHDIPVKAYY